VRTAAGAGVDSSYEDIPGTEDRLDYQLTADDIGRFIAFHMVPPGQDNNGACVRVLGGTRPTQGRAAFCFDHVSCS
jgi:hypothetical protein